MDYSPDYVAKLKRFNMFQVILAPYWFSSAESANAHHNDLEFRRTLEGYGAVDDAMVALVLKTWHRHEDFLIPERCFLSLVASKVSNDMKSRIACSMPEDFSLPKPPAPLKPATPITASTQLYQLAREERVSLPFFRFNIDHSFLTTDPAQRGNQFGLFVSQIIRYQL